MTRWRFQNIRIQRFIFIWYSVIWYSHSDTLLFWFSNILITMYLFSLNIIRCNKYLSQFYLYYKLGNIKGKLG